VTRLPPQQRLVVELRVFSELPFAAVAEVADCSEDAAKVNFHHALKRLRVLMNEEKDQ
jgi:RNA polymerase sigma-70 factor (ECF subfamily)